MNASTETVCQPTAAPSTNQAVKQSVIQINHAEEGIWLGGRQLKPLIRPHATSVGQTNNSSGLSTRGQSQRRGWPPPFRPKLKTCVNLGHWLQPLELQSRKDSILIQKFRVWSHKGDRASPRPPGRSLGAGIAPGGQGEGTAPKARPSEDRLGRAGKVHGVRGGARQSLFWQLI